MNSASLGKRIAKQVLKLGLKNISGGNESFRNCLRHGNVEVNYYLGFLSAPSDSRSIFNSTIPAMEVCSGFVSNVSKQTGNLCSFEADFESDFYSSRQCCGTVIIYCEVRFRLWKSFGFGSGLKSGTRCRPQYKFYKILPFYY